jgi:hypothetical protein
MEFFRNLLSSNDFYASWILLHVAARARMVACCVGLSDRTILFFDSLHAHIFHSQTPRCAIQLDLRVFWFVHPCLWLYTHHGGYLGEASYASEQLLGIKTPLER